MLPYISVMIYFTAYVLWFCHILFFWRHNFYSFLCSACFAVCSFSPEEVLIELIQSPGPHCSSPGRVPPGSGTIRRFLFDRKKGGPLQFLISCSGKWNFLALFLFLWSYDNLYCCFSAHNSSSCLLSDKHMIILHLADWEFAVVPMWSGSKVCVWSTYIVAEIPPSFCLAC